MNEGRFLEGGKFHFLLASQTLLLLAGNSLLVIQKAKLLQGTFPWQSDRYARHIF